jgi:hypothetical protein
MINMVNKFVETKLCNRIAEAILAFCIFVAVMLWEDGYNAYQEEMNPKPLFEHCKQTMTVKGSIVTWEFECE